MAQTTNPPRLLHGPTAAAPSALATSSHTSSGQPAVISLHRNHTNASAFVPAAPKHGIRIAPEAPAVRGNTISLCAQAQAG